MKRYHAFIAMMFCALALAAQEIDMSGATTQIRNIGSQISGIIGGLVGLVGIGRCAWKFAHGEQDGVTALVQGIAGLVLGQIAARMLG